MVIMNESIGCNLAEQYMNKRPQWLDLQNAELDRSSDAETG